LLTVALFLYRFFYNLSDKMYENYNLDSGKIECMYKFYVIIYLQFSCHCGLASCLKDEYDYDFDGGIETVKMAHNRISYIL